MRQVPGTESSIYRLPSENFLSKISYLSAFIPWLNILMFPLFAIASMLFIGKRGQLGLNRIINGVKIFVLTNGLFFILYYIGLFANIPIPYLPTHGEKISHYQSGRIEKKEQYYFGWLHGKCRYWFDQPNILEFVECNYYYGQKNGLESMRDEHGRVVLESEYYKNKYNGKVREYIYHESTSAPDLHERSYLNGQLNGLTFYSNANGIYRYKSNYTNGKLHGRAYTYYSDGRILEQVDYEDEFNYKSIYYGIGDKPIAECESRNGRLTGKQLLVYPDYMLICEFKNGNNIKISRYDKYWNLVSENDLVNNVTPVVPADK